MRTILTAKEWQRLRAHIRSLDDQAQKKLLHRIETWEKSVGLELGRVADGVPDGKISKSKALDGSVLEQVKGWLRK